MRAVNSCMLRVDLQLLIITPLNYIHIVDPYISALHFVYNNREGNNSRVSTISRKEFREKRKNFESEE